MEEMQKPKRSSPPSWENCLVSSQIQIAHQGRQEFNFIRAVSNKLPPPLIFSLPHFNSLDMALPSLHPPGLTWLLIAHSHSLFLLSCPLVRDSFL